MGTLVFALFLHSQLVQLVILYIIAPTPSLLTRSRSFTPLHSLNSRYFSHKIPFAKMYKFLILAASAAFASAYTTPTTQCTDGWNRVHNHMAANDRRHCLHRAAQGPIGEHSSSLR